MTNLVEVSLEHLTFIAEDQNKVFDAKFYIGSICLPFSDVGRI